MTINFPAGVEGETHVENDVTYTFTNGRWVAQMAAPLWQRTGTELRPTTANDDVDLGTGDLTANNGEFAGDLFKLGDYTFDSTTTSGAEFDTGSLTLQRVGSIGSESRSVAGRWGADITWEIKVDGSASFDEAVSAPNACTAWVNFAGANGALRGNFNVDGPVTRLDAGRYRIVFATEMDNSDYCVQVSSNQLTTIIDNIRTDSVDISVFDGGGTRVDTNIVCCTVYGGKD